MRRFIAATAAASVFAAAGILSAQDVGVSGPAGSAQASPGGASAQAGGAGAQASPGGASAQAGGAGVGAQASPSGAAAQAGPAGASTQAGGTVQGSAGIDAGAGTQAGAQAGADAQAGAGAQADANRPALGVTLQESGDALVVGAIAPNSPAAQAGLRPGDRIISLDGREFASTQAFIDAVQAGQLNAGMPIIVERNGQRQNLMVQLQPWGRVYPQGAWQAGGYGGGYYPPAQQYQAMRPAFDDPNAYAAPAAGYAASSDPCCCGASGYAPTWGYGYYDYGRPGRRR